MKKPLKKSTAVVKLSVIAPIGLKTTLLPEWGGNAGFRLPPRVKMVAPAKVTPEPKSWVSAPT
ncbi:MAG: hypothetical protein IPK44_00805 [Candidatus Accumulibacter sp.]|uniref:hypothetical protein n=1 Tax=Accumulibacter sp. TaxID=2053492 RepID=UPI00258671B3|nr:hypothetical protein [Accumulibacter sp.]MBK8113139.1 hypothetical protein [Accumulibacter sp.]